MWSGEQRASARRVIATSLEEEAAQRAADARFDRGLTSAPLSPFRDELARDQVVMQALARWDDRLAEQGLPAHALLHVTVTPGLASFAVRGASEISSQASAAAISLQLAPAWSEDPLAELTDRGAGELAQLAREAGHTSGPVIAVPAPRLVVLGAYLEKRGEVEARLLVNPILLAALEPHSGEAIGALPMATGTSAGGEDRSDPQGDTAGGGGGARGDGSPLDGGGEAQVAPPIEASAIGGNPYSFYGSVAECAAAQRTRCEACLPAGNCEAITEIPDGNIECEMLAAEEGRGYFLQCINLSLAITSVDECTEVQAPSCPRSPGAARSLSSLAANANFLDDETCQLGLNRCLARIFGAPKGEFPPGPGGGGGGSPPRDIDVSCGNSCDDDSNNGNCSSDPSCECTGPSCNNSFSCDSTCSNSNDQDGCGDSGGDDSGCSGGGGCSGDDGQSDSSCSDSDDGGSSDGGGCGGGDDGGSDSSGCGGGDGSSDSGCGGDSCGGDGSGGGDSCGGGSGDSGCGGGSGDSGCGGGDCGGSSGKSGGCSVAAPTKPRPSRPPAGLSFLLMGLWGLAPIPAALIARRRARRRNDAATTATTEIGTTTATTETAPSDAATASEEVAR